MSEPLISVIVPTYNTELYLRKCINSILKSSFKNFELIIVDDGSTDSSGVIADEFAANDGRIRVFHNENMGPASARRFGIDQAQADVILFVDSDDYISAELMFILYDNMMVSESDVVICRYYDVYENGKRVEASTFVGKAYDIISYEEIIHFIHGNREIPGGPYCKLVRKECFVGIDFHEDVAIGEDYSMILQVLKNANRVRLISDILYFRTMHVGNISRSGYTKRHEKALSNYITIRNELADEYPQYSREIYEYHLEYEMAVITAMCRNRKYDGKVISDLRNDLKMHKHIIWRNRNIPFANRFSAYVIIISPRVFMILFRVLHIMTGR